MLFREEDEELEVVPFVDRLDAGRALAGGLKAYSNRDDVVVLGLARGGVIVASAIASALHVPLDVCIVSKIGTPWNEELAMGAASECGVQVLDLSIIRELNVSDGEIAEAASAARGEIDSRLKLYRRGRPPLDFKGKTVILVDDGIATGCTMLAAEVAVRRRKAARVVVAVPAAPLHGCSAIQMEADDFVTVVQQEHLFAVSHCYLDFSQVSDETVQAVLELHTCVVLQAA
jgi:putative phosphoribosyl transferase